MRKAKDLSPTQMRVLERVRRAGKVRFEINEQGDHFFFDNGKTVPATTVRVLIREGLLRPDSSEQFAGTKSQTYVPA